ncbi:LuxR C-terminal-related transcriptional regulator [Massilia pinisoli]|uniref:LuxR C-terminal-related transcriptional regulator n=1 Tax=Massilia pinisoli TaxID=1772194 RepID=UPI00351CF822
MRKLQLRNAVELTAYALRCAGHGRARVRARSAEFSQRCLRQSGLTPREAQVAEHLLDGLTSKEIVSRSSISDPTVRKHRENLLVKVGVANAGQLIMLFLSRP